MKPFNLEEYLKNPKRKVVTKDGLNARIICTDRKDLKFPIVALIETKSGGEFLQYYTKDGTYYIDDLCDADLLFLPEKHEGWINIYKGRGGLITNPYVFSSREDAEESSRHCCGYTEGMYLATAKVEWEE